MKEQTHPWLKRPHTNTNAETNAKVFDQARKGNTLMSLRFTELLAYFPWVAKDKIFKIMNGIGQIIRKKG